MIDQQSKCCFLLPLILTAKPVSRKRKLPHVSRVSIGDTWSFDEIWRILIFHPLPSLAPCISSHSHLIITNRLLYLLFHVDVVEQIRSWVIIILHLFNVSHQLFLNQTINSYPITWWCSVFDFLIYYLLRAQEEPAT